VWIEIINKHNYNNYMVQRICDIAMTTINY